MLQKNYILTQKIYILSYERFVKLLHDESNNTTLGGTIIKQNDWWSVFNILAEP
jgi:hypothetical protein